MLVLVTGASGGIGSGLVARLVARGYSVRALSRREPSRHEANVEYVLGDLLDDAGMEKAASGVDSVFHLAALTHSHDRGLYERVNVSGTKSLASASARCGVRRFLFMSSRTAGDTGGAYARSKLRAEKEVRSAGLPWVILRPSEVYGAGHNEAIARVIRAVIKGPVVIIPGSGSAMVAPVYVDDVVDACVEALVSDMAVGKTYTLAGPEQMPLTRLVDRIETRLGKHRPRVRVPVPVLRCLALFAYLARSKTLVGDQIPRLLCAKSFDISPARTDLRYNPRTLEQGLDTLLSRASRTD